MVRSRAESSVSVVSQKSAYNPMQSTIPESVELVDMPDTINLIEKSLDQYEGLNNQSKDLDTIEHELEIKQKDIGKLEKKIQDVMQDISSLQDESEKKDAKIKKLQSGSISSLKARFQGSLNDKLSKETSLRDELREKLASKRDELLQLREDWQEEQVLLQVLKQQKSEFEWVRIELEILLDQVFEGPSPDFPKEDDMEEEVKALNSSCKRLEDQFQKYRKTESYIMEAQAFLERSITHLRDAKSVSIQEDRTMSKAIEKLQASRRASQEAYAVIESAAAIIAGFSVVLERFAPPLNPADAGFHISDSNTPSDFFRLSEFAHEHLRTQSIVKLSLARAARQLPQRAQETLERLMAERDDLEKAKKIHVAYRKQIVDSIYWEHKELENIEIQSDVEIDLALTEINLSPQSSLSDMSLPPQPSRNRSFPDSLLQVTSPGIARRPRALSNNILGSRKQPSQDEDFSKLLRRTMRDEGMGQSVDSGRSFLGVTRRSEDEGKTLRGSRSAASLRALLMPPPYEQVSAVAASSATSNVTSTPSNQPPYLAQTPSLVGSPRERGFLS